MVRPYCLNQTRALYNSDFPVQFLFFWGHQPSSGEVTKSCLSQWWPSSFSYQGLAYCCVEQFMMASKARLFGDLDAERAIMSSKEPKVIKSLGRKVKNFNQVEWDGINTKLSWPGI